MLQESRHGGRGIDPFTSALEVVPIQAKAALRGGRAGVFFMK